MHIYIDKIYLAKRFTAPPFVLGGKNSSEKNLSFDSIRLWIFSLKLW